MLALLDGGRQVEAGGGVTFRDIAAGDGAGITYRRARSMTDALFDALKHQLVYTINDIIATPTKSRGAPASLYSTSTATATSTSSSPTGRAGAKSLLQPAQRDRHHHVCRGGGNREFAPLKWTPPAFASATLTMRFPDLLVLGRNEPNRLFHNEGNGKFVDITEQSGMGGGNFSHTSCAMGDIDGDGLLDIVVSNTFDLTHSR